MEREKDICIKYMSCTGFILRKKYWISKEKKIYNLGHNILRLFDVLSNFSFTTSETNCDY